MRKATIKTGLLVAVLPLVGLGAAAMNASISPDTAGNRVINNGASEKYASATTELTSVGTGPLGANTGREAELADNLSDSTAQDQSDATPPTPRHPHAGARLDARHRTQHPASSTQPSDEQQWEAAMKFIDENSPIRARLLREANPPPGSVLREQVLQKYKIYTDINAHFPAMAKLSLQRFHLEDDLFGLAAQLRQDPGAREQLQPQIHDKVAQMAKLDISERELRITEMEKLLANERSELSHAQARLDEQIDDRTNRIIERGRYPLMPRRSDPASKQDATPPGNDH